MRSGVILVAVGVLVGASASLAFGAFRDDDGTADAHAVAELEIEPSMTGGPRGVGLLRQRRNERLSGSVVVWGLDPGSRHAVHFHGPDSSCGTKADPVAVHAESSAVSDNPGIACGDVRPRP
jgi:hypothetical protein